MLVVLPVSCCHMVLDPLFVSTLGEAKHYWLLKISIEFEISIEFLAVTAGNVVLWTSFHHSTSVNTD